MSEFSTAEIAQKVKISESSIRNFKAGRNEPSINFLKFLFTEFPNLNIKWLLFEEGEMLLKREKRSVEQRVEVLEKKLENIQPIIKALKQKVDELVDDFEEIDLETLTNLIKKL